MSNPTEAKALLSEAEEHLVKVKQILTKVSKEELLFHPTVPVLSFWQEKGSQPLAEDRLFLNEDAGKLQLRAENGAIYAEQEIPEAFDFPPTLRIDLNEGPVTAICPAYAFQERRGPKLYPSKRQDGLLWVLCPNNVGYQHLSEKGVVGDASTLLKGIASLKRRIDEVDAYAERMAPFIAKKQRKD